MKRASYILVFLISTYIVRGQAYFLANGQSKINNYIEKEKVLGSILFSNTTEYTTVIDSFDIAQPIRYERKDGKFTPSLLVAYYFSLPDSVVRLIIIEIDSSNFLKNRQNYFELNNRLPDFNQAYDKIRTELTAQIGTPKSTEELNKKAGFQNDFYWSRIDVWENDSVKVDLELVFSDQVKHNGTYRIRAYINYK